MVFEHLELELQSVHQRGSWKLSPIIFKSIKFFYLLRLLSNLIKLGFCQGIFITLKRKLTKTLILLVCVVSASFLDIHFLS